MNAPTQEILPAALAARLTEEQRQAVLEAPRAQRLAVIAAAFGLPEPDMLAAVAEAAHLDVLPAIRPDRASLSLIPARLVHDFQVVPITAPGAEEEEVDATAAAPDPRTVLHLATVWPPTAVMLDWIPSRPARWRGTWRCPTACTS